MYMYMYMHQHCQEYRGVYNVVAFPSKIQGISGGGHGLGEGRQAVASLGGLFKWVQVIEDVCTGGCIN